MTINRRTFLLNAAKTGLAVCTLPMLTSCGGVTRHALLDDVDIADLAARIGEERVEILRLASLSPNGHNTQPWTVTIAEPDKWMIGSDETRWLPGVDPENREMLLSIGAFLENLSIAAAHFGYAADIEILANTARDKEIAAVTLTRANAQSDYPIERLSLRRTVRSHFLSKELSAEDVAFITDGDTRRFHYFPLTSPEGKYLAEGTLEANRIQAYRTEAQEELANWIRWSNADARKHRDGLTPETMEISGFAGWYVRTFYDRNDVLKESFKQKTVDKVAEQVNTNGGWIVMTSEMTDIPGLIDTGRAFQRMFSNVRERKIAIHPMTQMLEENWQNAPQPSGANPQPTATDATTKASVKKQIDVLGLTDSPQFILRTGYLASYPEPVSLRRPVSWFTHV